MLFFVIVALATGMSCILGERQIKGGQANIDFVKWGKETLVFKRFRRVSDWDNEISVLQLVADSPFILQPLQADRDRRELVYRRARDSDLLRARGISKLSEAQMATLCWKLVMAVDALHRRGYLHLDVKPENIVRDGVDLWLIDLGLAAPIEEAPRYVGTARTMAPESLFSELRPLRLGRGADWWSVGVTIFYMYSRYYHCQEGDDYRHFGHFPYRVLWDDDNEPARLEWAPLPPRFPSALCELLFGWRGLLSGYRQRCDLHGIEILLRPFFRKMFY